MGTKVVVIGSGNIGTDLMLKVRQSEILDMSAMAGIDPSSDGLARAASLGMYVTSDGIEGLLEWPGFSAAEIIFDATSASAHKRNWEILKSLGKHVVDLTPAAVGPFVVPVVNMDENLESPNVNMVTCGGQATVPIVAAVSAVTQVFYAEIVASIASKSAGPGTRANIDEFTETTARALEVVGGASHGKAIIVLNPAEPPLIMRDTIFCLVPDDAPQTEIASSVADMVARVQQYVPGYRLKQRVQFDGYNAASPLHAPEIGYAGAGLKVSVFLEVEGAAQYLPSYAGNLDIMTSAALRTGERIAAREAVGA
jgi:acetaldehyde dehydrogenase